MKPRIYFSIETKVRELNSRILFALMAAQKGYSVVIGARAHLTRFREYLKTGIFISNGNTKRLANLSKSFADRGFKVGHLDEEGAITFDFIHHIFRYDFEVFNKIHFFFCCGQREKDAILANNLPGDPEKKIFITGNNRFDLLHHNFKALYDEEVKKIKKKYGEYILITTKFNKINYLNKGTGTDYYQGLIQSGYLRRDIDKYYGKESIKNDTKTKTDLEKFLIDIDNNFPNEKFLLKPHPGEDFNYWLSFKKKNKIKNLSVIPVNEFNTNSFILASKFLIASNCTTLLEAYLLGKMGINFLPHENKKLHYELTKSVSRNCYNINSLKSEIIKRLKDKNFKLKKLSKDEDYLLKYTIANLKKNSIDEMLKVIKNFAIFNDKHDKFTLLKYKNIYVLKENLVSLLKHIFRKDNFTDQKRTYSLQKNPGITKDEVEKIAKIICKIKKINFDNLNIKYLYPGLVKFEKNE
jgi:surface carbohydrate biosynthesis protein